METMIFLSILHLYTIQMHETLAASLLTTLKLVPLTILQPLINDEE